MILTLETKQREPQERADAVRARGAVPAVVYGPKEPSQSIEINAADMTRVWREAGETTIVSLSGLGAAKETLIRDVQVHPVTGEVLHVDFYALEKGKKIQIAVPLVFEGVAPVEKEGGVVSKGLHEIEIEVEPHELPHSLTVDLSVLAAHGDHITAAQVKLPKSATLITDGEEVVASVTAQQEEKEETPAEAPAAEAGEAAPAEEAEGEAAAE